MMGKWSDLPEDLLQLIDDFVVFYDDKVRIRATCLSWYSCFSKIPYNKEKQFPLVFQAPKDNKYATHALFNPIEKKQYLLDLPEFKGMLFKGSSHGWLMTIGDRDDPRSPKMSLINPLTRVRIKLPCRTNLDDVEFYLPEEVGSEYCIYSKAEGIGESHTLSSADEVNLLFTGKFVLSSDPCNNECLIAGIYGLQSRLAYCKLNDETWTPLLKDSNADDDWFEDIIFHNGKILTLQDKGQVLAFEVEGIGPCSIVSQIAKDVDEEEGITDYKKYLVASSDRSLIMAVRITDFIRESGCKNPIPHTSGFKVYKLIEANLSWVEVNNIGDDVLFLGTNSSVAISSSDCPEMYRRNHIYFIYTNRNGKWDTGIFSLEDGSLQSLPGFVNNTKFPCPPLWVNIH